MIRRVGRQHHSTTLCFNTQNRSTIPLGVPHCTACAGVPAVSFVCINKHPLKEMMLCGAR
ncbi:hypothetical protein GBAR_LOCUS27072, partial [Geodia barretti]